MSWGITAGRFLGYSFAGFLLETAVRREPHWSWVWGDARIPLVPVYGLGGLAAREVARATEGTPTPAVFAAQALVLTGLEAVGCRLSDRLRGGRQWGYGDDWRCTDLRHTLAWGALGTVVGKLDPPTR